MPHAIIQLPFSSICARNLRQEHARLPWRWPPQDRDCFGFLRPEFFPLQFLESVQWSDYETVQIYFVAIFSFQIESQYFLFNFDVQKTKFLENFRFSEFAM